MTVTEVEAARFDAPDRLDDDGLVTIRLIPSNWHGYNISPDTYQMFNGDSWTGSFIEWRREETGRDLTYDDFVWDYDHAGIVRDLAQEAADWIAETLWDAGLQSVTDMRLLDSWSPKFYNFQSDGFEIEFRCDPEELRALTPEFDVDEWGRVFYRSRDGFHSFVAGRLEDEDWRADYDGEFRVESLLLTEDPYHNREWVLRLAEAEWEVYDENVTVAEREYEDTGHSMSEWEEYAEELTAQTFEGHTPLDVTN